MNKKLIGVVFLVMVMCFNLLSIPINVFAKEKGLTTQNSKIDVTITADKGTLESGDRVDFKLAYKANSGHGSVKPGDKITFKTPKWLKDFKITFPPEHFKDVVVNGNEVVATFGDDVENLIGGYVNISATVGNIESQKTETIEIEVNGKVVSKIDVNIKPKEDDNKPNIVNRELLKTVDDATGRDQEGNTLSDVYAPVVGRIKEYRIYVNEEYTNMQGARLMDKMPQGMELIPNSLKITKVDNSNKETDVTNVSSVYKSPTKLDVTLGNINCKYIVTYTAKINKDFDKYINTAILYENDKKITSTVIVNKIEDKKVTINKRSYDTSTIKDSENQTVNVASKGQIVKYAIELNEKKVDISNVKLEDFIPKGMKYLSDSLRIGKYDNDGEFTWVTNELKDKTHQTDDKITIDFGNIKDHYIIYYSMKIEGVEDEYQNKAKVIYDNKSIETTDKVEYQMNVGAINGYKSVDKKEIKKDDDQEVIYSINFESFGMFEKGYLNVIDKLNDKVKILKVEAPDNFTVNVDKASNTVKIVNDKKDVKYGDKLQIKIHTDFKNVENGTTINNIANINDIPTNEVETKKGYAFEAKKVDAEDANISLKGSKFVLKNKDKKIIKELISDESGLINSEINEAGTYYLQEIEAPKGYLLENKDIEFKISEDDIGKTIKLGNIKNKKLKHADETTEEIPGEVTDETKPIPKPEVVNPTETEDGLVKPEVTKPEVTNPEIHVDETAEEIPKEETGEIKPIPTEKVDPKESEDGSEKPEVTKPEIHVDETTEETTKEETGDIKPIPTDKVDPKESEDGSEKPEVTKPEIHVDETTEETPKEETGDIKPIPTEKVEPKENEDGLVKPEVTKPEIHEPSKKEEPRPSTPEEPKKEDKKEEVPSTKEEPKVEDKKEQVPPSKEEPKKEDKKEEVPPSKEEPKKEDKKEEVPSTKEEPKKEDKKEEVPSTKEEPKKEDKKEEVPSTKEEPKKEDKKEQVPPVKEEPKKEDKKEPVPPVKYTSPKTGDSSMLGYVVTLTSVSMCGLVINRRKK